MKYQCIAQCFVDNTIIMKPGDIVVIKDNQLYNTTTGCDYKNIPDIDKLMPCLKVFTAPELTGIEQFKQIASNMIDTYSRKNHDYGNSFDQSLDNFGLIASAIRIGDKMNRFESLIKKVAQVKDESLRDTLLDMANYAIMTIMWIDNNLK